MLSIKVWVASAGAEMEGAHKAKWKRRVSSRGKKKQMSYLLPQTKSGRGEKEEEKWASGELESNGRVRCCDKRDVSSFFWRGGGEETETCFQRNLNGWHEVAKCIIACEQRLRGAVPVLCRHAAVFTANKWAANLSRHVSGGRYDVVPRCRMCPRSLCNNSTTGSCRLFSKQEEKRSSMQSAGGGNNPLTLCKLFFKNPPLRPLIRMCSAMMITSPRVVHYTSLLPITAPRQDHLWSH